MGDVIETAEAALILGVSPITVRSMVLRQQLAPLVPGSRPLTFWERDVWELEWQRRTRKQVLA